MEMTRERISFTFDPRDMLISLQMGFSFVRAAVACAVLERSSGLEPSSETTARSKVLEACYSAQLLPLTSSSLWMPLALFFIRLVFSALISILYPEQVLSRLSTRASSSCCSSASHRQPQIGNISAAYANLPIMFFQGIRHDPFKKNVEEGG